MANKVFTKITSGQEAREKILNGVNAVADVVGSTMGYRGSTVLLERDGLPEPTKDGYDVAESIFLEDEVEALACETAKEASRKTMDEAGDNTTATMVLLQAFVQNSFKELDNGRSRIDIKLEIEKSKDLVVDYLDKLAIPLTKELIYFVAKTSANGDDEIAQLVADAFEKAGENGSVGHTRSNNDKTFIEHAEGTLIERGYADERFVNVFSNQSVTFTDNPLVLISNITFTTVQEILPFLKFAGTNNRELLIISEMDFAVQNVILKNVKDNNLKFAVITPPAIGKKREQLLSDLALVCNTTMIDGMSGNNFETKFQSYLGQAKSIVSTKENTIIVKLDETPMEPILGKIEELKAEIKLADKNFVLKKNLEERVAKLSGGVSMIKVGGITPSEIKEKIARVDDAVCAVRAAREEGVVAGGGVALHSAGRNILNLDKITKEAIFSPFDKILSNADKENIEVIAEYPNGYDVKEFKVVDMFEAGIIDAKKAVKNAYVNAVSASINLLMTDSVITLSK